MNKKLMTIMSIFIIQIVLIHPTGAVDAVSIQGSGSSFVAPAMEQWTSAFYNDTNNLVSISYASVGSGTGISNLIAQTVDFAGSDAPLNSQNVADLTSAGGVAVTIPDTMGAIVMIYNIPSGLTGTLNLTAANIAHIYQGTVTTWNDAELTANNPGLTSTATIHPVHRTDSSGTSFAFSDFLDRATPDWTQGTTKDLSGLSGLGGSKNDGVAGAVQTNDYSLGYVELNYAQANSLNFANVQNKDGNWVTATSAGVAAAAASASSSLPAGDGDWSSVSINWVSGADSYPICTFTYIMAYKDMSAAGNKGPALVAFLTWLMSDEAQNMAEPLGYVALPQAVRTLNTQTISSISITGNPSDYTPTTSSTPSSSSQSNPDNSTAPGFDIISMALVLISATVVILKKRNQ